MKLDLTIHLIIPNLFVNFFLIFSLVDKFETSFIWREFWKLSKEFEEVLLFSIETLLP